MGFGSPTPTVASAARSAAGRAASTSPTRKSPTGRGSAANRSRNVSGSPPARRAAATSRTPAGQPPVQACAARTCARVRRTPDPRSAAAVSSGEYRSWSTRISRRFPAERTAPRDSSGSRRLHRIRCIPAGGAATSSVRPSTAPGTTTLWTSCRTSAIRTGRASSASRTAATKAGECDPSVGSRSWSSLSAGTVGQSRTAARTTDQNRPGSSWRSSAAQATSVRSSAVRAQWARSAVLPNPAGAHTSTVRRSVPSSAASRRGRGTKPSGSTGTPILACATGCICRAFRRRTLALGTVLSTGMTPAHPAGMKPCVTAPAAPSPAVRRPAALRPRACDRSSAGGSSPC